MTQPTQPAIGSNFAFNLGELVLCYEPDPSKAKLLYDAKITDVDSTKDDFGNVMPEYYVHFIGWNKSWDRWILESGILKDNETNRVLQAKLVNKVVKRSAGKRQRQQLSENLEDDQSSESRSSVSQSGSDIASESENVRNLPLVSMRIPLPLKAKLEDDCYNIKRKKLLIKLPRQPSVREILEEYYEKCCNERDRPRNHENVSSSVVRDVVDGLLTCFDFTLATLLLYNFEHDQYWTLFPSAGPLRPASSSSVRSESPRRKSRAQCRDDPLVGLEDTASAGTVHSMHNQEEGQPQVEEKTGEEQEENSVDESLRGRVLRSRRSTLPNNVEGIRSRPRKRLRVSRSPMPRSPSSLDTLTDSRDSEISFGKTRNKKGAYRSTQSPLPCQQGTRKRPSDIYGSEHLLRLFVKLPSLLARMDMDERKQQTLLDYVWKLLMYLSDKVPELFSPDNYTDMIK